MFAAGIGALITEIIPGDDSRFCSYYTYLDENGRPLLHFTKRKPRQYPIAFGIGTFHTTKWQPDVAELGLRFLQGVGLRGLGYVEFKLDERDGELKLIECNPRISMANAIAARAGIDLAQVAYNRLVGRDLPPVDTFRDDVCLWFVREDVRALRAYRAAGQLTVAEWLRTLAHVPHFPTFEWRDPMPAVAGARGAIRRMRRRPAPKRRETTLDDAGATEGVPSERNASS
jgi:predicted ATP-grasp superfamily ATP-dependent carboligase